MTKLTVIVEAASTVPSSQTLHERSSSSSEYMHKSCVFVQTQTRDALLTVKPIRLEVGWHPFVEVVSKRLNGRWACDESFCKTRKPYCMVYEPRMGFEEQEDSWKPWRDHKIVGTYTTQKANIYSPLHFLHPSRQVSLYNFVMTTFAFTSTSLQLTNPVYLVIQSISRKSCRANCSILEIDGTRREVQTSQHYPRLCNRQQGYAVNSLTHMSMDSASGRIYKRW